MDVAQWLAWKVKEHEVMCSSPTVGVSCSVELVFATDATVVVNCPLMTLNTQLALLNVNKRLCVS